MNNKISVKYEYEDIHKVKQQQEFSMSSNYTNSFSIYQVADFVLNVISLTGYPVETVLVETVEASDYGDQIVDELTYLGYGSKEKE